MGFGKAVGLLGFRKKFGRRNAIEILLFLCNPLNIDTSQISLSAQGAISLV
jgi:hypothetical protein